MPKGLYPLSLLVMAEVCKDISAHTPDHVDRYVEQGFNLVLTVSDSARETCPIFPGANHILHHVFKHPDKLDTDEAELLAVFCRVRDDIGDYIHELRDTMYSTSQ